MKNAVDLESRVLSYSMLLGLRIQLIKSANVHKKTNRIYHDVDIDQLCGLLAPEWSIDFDQAE